MNRRLAVVGLGLMGGSLGLAARERVAADVAGFDPDPAARAAAVERGCVTTAHDDLASALAGADLVCVCAPTAELPQAIAEALAAAPEATVTDIGSTKSAVVASIAEPDRGRFVGGHRVGSAAGDAGQLDWVAAFELSLHRGVDRAAVHPNTNRAVVPFGRLCDECHLVAHRLGLLMVVQVPRVVANLLYVWRDERHQPVILLQVHDEVRLGHTRAHFGKSSDGDSLVRPR